MERILYECRTSDRGKGKLIFKEFFRLVLLNLACVILSHYPNYGYDYGGVGGVGCDYHNGGDDKDERDYDDAGDNNYDDDDHYDGTANF